MADSLPLHDLEGRDVQTPAFDSNSPGGKRRRILLSMVGSDGITHGATIIPLPASYMVGAIFYTAQPLLIVLPT